MCQDKSRLLAYEEALKKVSPGKIVVDVGAGTGVLSIFAAKGGASKVYAIENAAIVSTLSREIRAKKLEDSIKIMNCLAEEAPLDNLVADIIVSEWMGYFLLCERMLPSVLAVRDKCLSKTGLIVT